MEFVGKTVKKNFKGFGLFSGTVESYDSSTGLFKVIYDDGDSEELELHEITPLLDSYLDSGTSQPPAAELTRRTPRVGRKPRKRRRSIPGNDSYSSKYGEGGILEKTAGGGVEGEETSLVNGNVDFNYNLSAGLSRKGAIDLNQGLSIEDDVDGSNLARGLDLNYGIDLNVNDGVRKHDTIDLNLDVNKEGAGNMERGELEGCQKREHGFDLNLSLDDENRSLDADRVLHEKTTACSEIDGGAVKRALNGVIPEVLLNGEVKCGLGNQIPIEGGTFSGKSKKDTNLEVSDNLGLDGDGVSKIHLACLTAVGTPTVHEDQQTMGAATNGRTGRKRRKLSDSVKPVAEPVLRRSTRRGRAIFSDPDHVASAVGSVALNEVASSSPAVASVSEEMLTVSRREAKIVILGKQESEVPSVHPPKPELPPSSRKLNLEGMPELDIFSVYSFLRSFSILLFLSPFDLNDFVEAVKCATANSLFDSIHFSLLQILRKHLESLPDESAPPLSNCYRGLNWEFLDMVTWPIFMVEYLLLRGFRLDSTVDLFRLKLLESDYYRQTATVKISILQWLCDEVIESEAIKSELNRRTLATDPIMNFDHSVKIESSRKRIVVMDVSGGSCLTDEEVDEANDWNSDECCLCRMDGNLICCDGCPAAFHTRCVGVSTSLLPEGDWYCPECLIDRDKPWMKLAKSTRGARLLGIDPHDRLYYASCGYLLVLDISATECLFNYYHRDDLPALIEILKPPEIECGTILGEIIKHWNVLTEVNEVKSVLASQGLALCSDLLKKGKVLSTSKLQDLMTLSADYIIDKTINPGKLEEKYTIPTCSGDMGSEVSVLVNLESAIANHSMRVEIASVSSEGSAEIYQAATDIQNLNRSGMDVSNECRRKASGAVFHKRGVLSGDSFPMSDQRKSIRSEECSGMSSTVTSSYVNNYEFARASSLVAEELTLKLSDKKVVDLSKSVEEIISAQLKAISNKSTTFFWPNVHNFSNDGKNEKCGWCFSCKYPEDDRDCLIMINGTSPPIGSFITDMPSLCSNKNMKDHLIDVMCCILSIEDRLSGLLLGPWLNPNYSKLWRQNVIMSADVTSLKHLLLMLESNVHRLAFSPEWLKHVDCPRTMGSASLVMTSSSRVCSRNGIARKRTRCSDLESSSSSNAASGLGLFWWRGGRLSRELFHWKVLPNSLCVQAARQGGSKKISGILYLDGSELAKRSKCVAWRAAVGASRSVEQLALQIREFHANIKWNDIENTYHFLTMDKESTKSVRSFRKAIVRRKCLEESVVKYLLDFGKRRFIPEVVMKNGTMLADASSGRKKYWLEESHVPLHLLKGFEERRIARKSNTMNSGKLGESNLAVKKPAEARGLSYLFSRAERSENSQCGHCNKIVLIREAVSCQYCKGFFHKRHVKKSSGPIAAECTYTCHKCKEGVPKFELFDTKKDKLQTQSKRISKVVRATCRKNSKKLSKRKKPAQSQRKGKNAVVVPLRRSTRKVKCVLVQSMTKCGRKKGRKPKSKRKRGTKPGRCTWKKKRTEVCRSYWLNGLLFSRKVHDDRVMHFKSKKLLILSEELSFSLDLPKCGLCLEREFTSKLSYIGCEACGEWFHGVAFGLSADNVPNLIGFKCHKCRNRSPPVCPQFEAARSIEVQSVKLNDDSEVEHAIRACDDHVVCANLCSDEESKKLILSDHKELQLDAIPVLGGTLASVKETEDSLFGLEQKTDAIHSSNNWRQSDLLMKSDERTSCDRNAYEDVTVFSDQKNLLSMSCIRVVETELTSEEHNDL